MILIGLGNRARHGKDTAANAILLHAVSFNLPVLRVSWADALYAEVNKFLSQSEPTDVGHGIYVGVPVKQLFNLGVVEDVDGVRTWTEFPKWVQPTPDAEVSERAPYGKHSKLLQWWGTEYRRAQDETYWVKKGVEAIRSFQVEHSTGVVVVPDTRFLNEASAIKALGGYTLNVTRLVEEGQMYVDPTRDAKHASETELECYNWDFRIVSKNPKLTEKLAVATFEFIREQRGT